MCLFDRNQQIEQGDQDEIIEFKTKTEHSNCEKTASYSAFEIEIREINSSEP